jgi:hypothetical protein
MIRRVLAVVAGLWLVGEVLAEPIVIQDQRLNRQRITTITPVVAPAPEVPRDAVVPLPAPAPFQYVPYPFPGNALQSVIPPSTGPAQPGKKKEIVEAGPQRPAGQPGLAACVLGGCTGGGCARIPGSAAVQRAERKP